jgi:uncharacterized protein (TIGR02284 family)
MLDFQHTTGWELGRSRNFFYEKTTMIRSDDDLIRLLNNLIEACIDAEEGLELAAENTKDFELRAFLADGSRLRTTMANDLQNLVRSLGFDPATKGTTTGMLHRQWVILKQAFIGKSDFSILADCRRAEESVVNEYRSTLEKSLPSEPETLVRRQFAVIVATCERLKSLERSLANP